MGDMEVMVDTDMVDTVASDLLMPKQGTDVVMDLEVMAVMEVMPVTVDFMVDTLPDTVLDMVMVDTVASDLLMPGTDVDMAVMVDTAVDMAVMEVMVMAVDTVDTDTASKYLPTPKNH